MDKFLPFEKFSGLLFVFYSCTISESKERNCSQSFFLGHTKINCIRILNLLVLSKSAQLRGEYVKSIHSSIQPDIRHLTVVYQLLG
jgi:hypothetical protein